MRDLHEPLPAFGAQPIGAAPASDDRTASDMTWEPYEGECPVPSNKEWRDLSPAWLPVMRLAWVACVKTKPELMECMAGLIKQDDGRLFFKMIEDFREVGEITAWFAELLRAAEVRCLCAVRESA